MNFEKLFNCIFTLNHVSLKTTVKVLSLRFQIRENINNLCNEMDDIKNEIHSKKNLINYNIYKKLESGINSLHQIVLKNNELNQIALKKDKNKYGYSKQLLMENISKKLEKCKVYDFFQNLLKDIDYICSSEKNKERIISNFIKENL